MTDPSALSVALGWALFAFVAFLTLTIAAVIRNNRNHKLRAGGQASGVIAPASTVSTCTTTGCGRRAYVVVVTREDIGREVRMVCHGCSDEGQERGWWEFVGEAAS